MYRIKSGAAARRDRLVRTAYDIDGRAVEVCDTIMAADAYLRAGRIHPWARGALDAGSGRDRNTGESLCAQTGSWPLTPVTAASAGRRAGPTKPATCAPIRAPSISAERKWIP